MTRAPVAVIWIQPSRNARITNTTCSPPSLAHLLRTLNVPVSGETSNGAVTGSTEAVDWYLELTSFRTYIEGVCILDPYIEAPIRRGIVSGIERANSVISTLLGQAFGQVLSVHFEAPDGSTDRITPDDLTPCGDPATGGSDFACQSALLFGGRRHRCSDDIMPPTLNSAGEYVCDIANLEVRRMLVRPEGIELVFAEGSDDPQHDLLQYETGLIESGSGVSGFLQLLSMLSMSTSLTPSLAPEDPVVCDPLRWSAVAPPTAGVERGVFGWYASSILIPSGTAICTSDDTSCAGLCGQYGTTCTAARTFGLDQFYGTEPLPTSGPLVCREGTCIAAP